MNPPAYQVCQGGISTHWPRVDQKPCFLLNLGPVLDFASGQSPWTSVAQTTAEARDSEEEGLHFFFFASSKANKYEAENFEASDNTADDIIYDRPCNGYNSEPVDVLLAINES